MGNSKRNIASFMEGFKPYMDMMLQLQIKKNEQRDRLTEELQKEQRGMINEGKVSLSPTRPGVSLSDTRRPENSLSLLPGVGNQYSPLSNTGPRISNLPLAGMPLPPAAGSNGVMRGGQSFSPPNMGGYTKRAAYPASTARTFAPAQEPGNAFALNDKQYNFAGEKYEQKPGEIMTTEYGPNGLSKGFKVSSGNKPLTAYQSATLAQKQKQFEASLVQRIKEGFSAAKQNEVRAYIGMLPYSADAEVKLNELLGDDLDLDSQALKWAKENPNDPRAKQIIEWQ